MNDVIGFRGGSVPPVKDRDVDAFHDFIRWLEDHNYCKVTFCVNCYFWHGKNDPEYDAPFATCRKHKIKTCHDDYCSDALEVKR